jgi:hypothetical protein
MAPRKRTTATSPLAPSKRSRGTATQPISIEDSQPSPSQISLPLSPRRALIIAATQATEDAPFESQLRVILPEEAIVAPAEASEVATVAITEGGDGDEAGARAFDDILGNRFEDNFEGIDWHRLPRYCRPASTQKHKKSWIYQHGYRVALVTNPKVIYFICRYCHQHKIIDSGGSGQFDVTTATTSAAAHLGLNKTGHRLTKNGLRPLPLVGGARSIAQLVEAGIRVPQRVANAVGGFDCQRFRLAAVLWLVENNHPLSEFTSASFREMMELANPEAAAALWVSRQSVSRFVMRLFSALQPLVVEQLSQAISKVHISFDGWTTKGGKRGYLGIVAHFAIVTGRIIDLPIGLPQLVGAHTGERIAEVIATTLRAYAITPSQLGYFVLDNASSNDVAVTSIARLYNFNPIHRRLRCCPHTINLVGQTVIFGKNRDAYDNASGDLEVSQRARYYNIQKE